MMCSSSTLAQEAAAGCYLPVRLLRVLLSYSFLHLPNPLPFSLYISLFSHFPSSSCVKLSSIVICQVFFCASSSLWPPSSLVCFLLCAFSYSVFVPLPTRCLFSFFFLLVASFFYSFPFSTSHYILVFLFLLLISLFLSPYSYCENSHRCYTSFARAFLLLLFFFFFFLNLLSICR